MTLDDLERRIQGLPKVFAKRCYAERGYATVCPSVRPSVTFRYWYRDHIGWNSAKIISRPNSARLMRGLIPTWAIWCNGNTPKIAVDVVSLRSKKTCSLRNGAR